MSVDLPNARLIAGMIYPARQIEDVSAPSPEGYADLVKACRRNKVPLLSLDESHAPLEAFYASETYRRARAEEQECWRGQRTHYLALQKALDPEVIHAVLIKSVGIPPSLPYISDNLDVLVKERHGGRARQALLGLGYIELKNVEEPHKFLFRKFHTGRTVSAIHLHEFVGWGTGFMTDDQVLAGARASDDDPILLIPSAEDGLLITMAHAFYEDKEVKLGDLWKVMHVLRQADLDWDRILAQARLRGWEEGIWTCIWLWSELEARLYGEHSFPEPLLLDARRGAPGYSRDYLQQRFDAETVFPFRVSFRFSKRHYYRKVRADQALGARQKAVDALRHTLAGVYHHLPLTSQRPMLVSLSGVDGSGKTAHAQALHSAFHDCAIRVVTVWSRVGASKFTDRVIGLVKPLLGRSGGGLDTVSQTRQARVERKKTWLHRPLLRLGWSALVVVDLILNYWRRVAWPLLLGNVVICDRYTYDALVEIAALADVPDIADSWIVRLIGSLTPRPQLAYLLDVSADQALARKPDELRPFVGAQVFVYHTVASRWHMRRLDTNLDFASASDHLTREVLTDYYRDWHTLINGLFMTNPIKRG